MFGDANYLPVCHFVLFCLVTLRVFFSPKKKFKVFKNNKSIFFNFEIVAFPHLQISEIANVSTRNNTTLAPPRPPLQHRVCRLREGRPADWMSFSVADVGDTFIYFAPQLLLLSCWAIKAEVRATANRLNY